MPLITLGLWGDGDELHAVDDAFEAIKVQVPEEDAPTWVTVGDLWRSVIRVAPSVAGKADSWDKFRRALAGGTLVDWTAITAETTLLDGKGGGVFVRTFRWLRDRMRGSVGD